MGRGLEGLKRAAFPVCFFLVAIPWPTLIEQPIIQGLTRFCAALVVEVMGIFGIPAMQHGNVIEVASGVVGIDEACSGIRSFQSSLMISLFLGEFYALSRVRRCLLVPAGFVLAIVFNVCRTSLLTWVAAKKGVAAIDQYHDPAGVTILLACTAVTWGIAWACRKPKPGTPNPGSEGAKAEGRTMQEKPAANGGWAAVRPLAYGLLVWLAVVEGGVQAWYRAREAMVTPGPKWSIVFPRANPTFKTLAMDEKTMRLLRFDEGEQGTWNESDGTVWSAFYFGWRPGRVAGYLAKRHTPEICMPAEGLKLVAGPELMLTKVNGVELPMRHYVFGTGGNALQVFQCRWEEGMGKEAYVQHESARFNLLRGIWAGRGIHGQKVIEIIVSGCEDSEQAKQALVRQLEKMIKVEGRAA
jgi:exosortase/archaeosortase family protein